MRTYQEMLVKKTERVLLRVNCDQCNLMIDTDKEHFRVTTHHSRWGNDSGASYDFLDFCSPKCLRIKFGEYLADAGDTSKFESEKIGGFTE